MYNNLASFENFNEDDIENDDIDITESDNDDIDNIDIDYLYWMILTILIRIGLAGFDNPMRDSKTEEVKRHIGQVSSYCLWAYIYGI